MLKRYLSVTLLAVLMALSSLQANNKNLLVTGTIMNPYERMIALRFFKNFVLLEEFDYIVELDQHNSFTFEVGIAQPMPLQFVYGNRTYRLFAQPGDLISVTMDARYKEKSILKFGDEGSSGANNNYLMQTDLLFSSVNSVALTEKMHQLQADSFKRYIDDCYDKQIAFFEQSKTNLSAAFQIFAKNDIEYWRAYQLMRYRWEHPAAKGIYEPLRLPDSYHNFFKTVNINNDQALYNPYYLYFINQYLPYLQELEKEQRGNNTFHSITDLAYNYLRDGSLAYILCQELCSKAKRLKIEDLEVEVYRFIDEFDYIEYQTTVARVLEDVYQLKNGRVAPDFKVQDADGNILSLNDFKGKVIYLNFWATWSKESIAGIRNIAQVQQHFSQEDVLFIHVALDSDKPQWKQVLLEENLGGNQYWIEGGYGSEMAQRYGVQKVPNSFIIAKSGRLARMRVAKLTEQKVIAQISEVLQMK